MQSSPDTVIRWTLIALALVGFTWTATPSAFWLDSSELAAAGALLGIPHAPGHPLYVVLAHVASLLPVGSVGFRIAFLSALLGALCVGLVYDLTMDLINIRSSEAKSRWPAAVSALVFASSSALWLQSVRAEVYTLNLLLSLFLTRLALQVCANPSAKAVHLMPLGAFVFGLACGNHHLLIFAHLPALACLLLISRGTRREVVPTLPWTVLAGLFGLLIYLLLPLRAAQDPLINYGDPSSFSRFVDVILARVFVPSVAEASMPLVDNIGHAADMFLHEVGPVLLIAAPFGLFAIGRIRPWVACALALGILGNLMTKLVMNLDPTNPDAAGYFALGFAFVACLGGVALEHLSRLSSSLAPPAAWGVGLLACAMAGVGMMSTLPRVALAQHRSPATIDAWLMDRVEPDALLLTSFFALHFNRLYQTGAEGYRPDVLVAHQGLEDHVEKGRPFAKRLVTKDARLKNVTDAFLQHGRFPKDALLQHAATRPVYVEPTFGLPLPMERLEYSGGFFRLRGPQETPAPENLEAQLDDQRRLWSTLRYEMTSQRETRTTLALLWLQLTVVRLQQGYGFSAAAALEFLRLWTPKSPYIDTLQPYVDELVEASRSGDTDRLTQVKARHKSTNFRQGLGFE